MRFTFFFGAPDSAPPSLGTLAAAARFRAGGGAGGAGGAGGGGGGFGGGGGGAGGGGGGAGGAGGSGGGGGGCGAALAAIDWEGIRNFGWPSALPRVDFLPSVIDGAYAAIEAFPELGHLALDDVFQLVAFGRPTLEWAIVAPRANLDRFRQRSFRPSGQISALAGF